MKTSRTTIIFIHYRVQKKPPLVPVLSQLKRVYNLTPKTQWIITNATHAPPHCNTRLSSRAAGRCLRGRSPWGRSHVRQRWSPRTATTTTIITAGIYTTATVSTEFTCFPKVFFTIFHTSPPQMFICWKYKPTIAKLITLHRQLLF